MEQFLYYGKKKEYKIPVILGDNESEADTVRRKAVRSFWVTGQSGMTIGDAAVLIVDEAREMLQKDLGMKIDWGSSQERQENLSRLMNGETIFT